MKKKIAIFDIDGTVFRSSLAIELYEQLVLDGIFSKSSWQEIEKLHKQWLNREGGYEKYLNLFIDKIKQEIKGKKQTDIVRASRRMLNVQKKWTYRYTRNLVEKARRDYFTIGISGSPLEVVREYNKVLEFDKIYGTEFGTDEKGKYTGAVIHEPPRYKKEVIARYIKNHGMSLKGSFGVGDTESDIGFLELVEEPIAFNPNFELAEHARQNNWTVVVERKDMIYEFKPKSVKYLHAE